jgi:hypothetical protein
MPGRPGEPPVPGAATNALWLSDFTYVATWQGFVYVAFVIDAYARRIVGWRVARTAHAGLVLMTDVPGSFDSRYFGPVRAGGCRRARGAAMDLVTLATLCAVGVEPRVMQALAIVRSEGKAWSFRGSDGALRSFAGPREAAFAARKVQGELLRISVGLTGLPVDLGGAAAQPNAGLFEPCVNVVLAGLRLEERARTVPLAIPRSRASAAPWRPSMRTSRHRIGALPMRF